MTDHGSDNELPQDFSYELTNAQEWLNSLISQTEEQIRGQIKGPSKPTAWNFEGKLEPVIEFKVGTAGHLLLLYFYENKVIKASLQLLSE